MAQTPTSQSPGGAAPGGLAPGGQPHGKPPARAQHGYINEVRWRGGQGRQPYANRGEEESAPPVAAQEVEGGDRGEHSGNALENLRQVRQKP